MSNNLDNTPTVTHTEPDETKSYVIGFLLSLILTAIPSYLVINKSLSSSALLATILGIAVVQMIVQIFFFLHLGRGPKPFYNVIFFISTVGVILIVVGGSIFIMNNLHYNMTPADTSKKLIEKEGIYQITGERTGACQGVQTNHKITIRGDTVTPIHLEAQRCDTLTFMNEAGESRKMSFGAHPQDQTYAGDNELEVRKGRSKTITLSEEGTYLFHDHTNSAVAGSFTVKP